VKPTHGRDVALAWLSKTALKRYHRLFVVGDGGVISALALPPTACF
jgi:hypothetical protein